MLAMTDSLLDSGRGSGRVASRAQETVATSSAIGYEKTTR